MFKKNISLKNRGPCRLLLQAQVHQLLCWCQDPSGLLLLIVVLKIRAFIVFDLQILLMKHDIAIGHHGF